VNFPRLLFVTGALAATVSVSDDIAAQSLTADETIAVQSSWTSGYMGLGGGLVRAMPEQSAKKTSTAPERRVVRRAAHRVAHRVYDPGAPIVLIAETLDHTGENIATLGARTGSR
jgi:hypothetical protein